MSNFQEVMPKLFLLIFVVLYAQAANKYSEDSNVGSTKPEREFRAFKINMVWEKAQKKLTPQRLGDLFAELRIQDKLELQAKKRRTDGLDQDGENEAFVRDRLLDILRRFDIIEHFEHLDNKNSVEENLTLQKNANSIKLESIKKDPKLSKLWKKAQVAGFTENELEDLKHEFIHHQQKVEMYENLKNDVYQMEGLASDNAIDGFKDETYSLKNIKEKRKELKHTHADMQDSLKNLQSLTDPLSSDFSGFTDPKVVELWYLAKMTNFSNMELDSFREELKHFEHKLKKHEHLKSEFELTKEVLKKDKTNKPHLSSKHAEMEEKVENYGRKVKKYHTELKWRISKALGRHSEL